MKRFLPLLMLTGLLFGQDVLTHKSGEYFYQLDNKIYLKDYSGNQHILIQNGQQIKINDDKRKLFFQGYNHVTNTITVKDISYRVIYTKRKKIDYNVSEINRIQLRLDKSLIRNILLWYPNFFMHGYPAALLTGALMRLSVAITGDEVDFIAEAGYEPKDEDADYSTLKLIQLTGMIYTLSTAFINSWPTAKKFGKGQWISIPLKGDDEREIFEYGPDTGEPITPQVYGVKGHWSRSSSIGFSSEKIPISFYNYSLLYNIDEHSELYGTFTSIIFVSGIGLGYKYYTVGKSKSSMFISICALNYFTDDFPSGIYGFSTAAGVSLRMIGGKTSFNIGISRGSLNYPEYPILPFINLEKRW